MYIPPEKLRQRKIKSEAGKETGRRPGGAPWRLLLFVLLGALIAAVVYASLNWNAIFPKSPSNHQVDEEDFSIAGLDFISDKQNRVILRIRPTFIVNLSGLDGKYMMRVQVRMEVDNRAVADELNKAPAKFHRIVDEILTVLKSKTYVELATQGGIERLKAELRDRINRYIERGRVLRVIFHELMFDRQPDYPRRG